MLFKTSKKKVQTLLLQMDNKIIDKVLDFNFLGIHFNEQLNWKSHIDKLSVKCCRILGILNRLKRTLPSFFFFRLFPSGVVTRGGSRAGCLGGARHLTRRHTLANPIPTRTHARARAHTHASTFFLSTCRPNLHVWTVQ